MIVHFIVPYHNIDKRLSGSRFELVSEELLHELNFA